MTKAEIQLLIEEIDTTGNNGTTGQELKDIYEAMLSNPNRFSTNLNQNLTDAPEQNYPFDEGDLDVTITRLLAGKYALTPASVSLNRTKCSLPDKVAGGGTVGGLILGDGLTPVGYYSVYLDEGVPTLTVRNNSDVLTDISVLLGDAGGTIPVEFYWSI